jgi:hypothetical protein
MEDFSFFLYIYGLVFLFSKYIPIVTTFPGVVTIFFFLFSLKGEGKTDRVASRPRFCFVQTTNDTMLVGGRESNVFFVGNNFVYFRHRHHLQLKATDCHCISLCKEPDQISRQEKKRK